MKKIFLTILFIALSSQVFAYTCTGNKYWVGGGSSSNWDATGNTNWATSTGGANNAAVPVAGDGVCLDASSGTGTVTMDVTTAALASFDSTAFTGTFTSSGTLTVRGANSTTEPIYFPTASTFSWTGLLSITTGGTGRIYNLETNGNTLSGGITMNATSGGTLNFNDATNLSTGTLTLTNGSLVTNGNTVTMGILSSSNSNTRTLNITNSIVNIGSTGTVINLATATSLTLTTTGSTVNITDTSSTGKTIDLQETQGSTVYAFNNFSITGGGTGAVTIDAAEFSLGNFTVGAPKTVTFTKSTEVYFSNISAIGSSGNSITMNSSTSGTGANLFIIPPYPFNVNCNWLTLKDVPIGTATSVNNLTEIGNVKFYAGANSTLTSDDAGWLLQSPPTINDKLTGTSKITGTSLVN